MHSPHASGLNYVYCLNLCHSLSYMISCIESYLLKQLWLSEYHSGHQVLIPVESVAVQEELLTEIAIAPLWQVSYTHPPESEVCIVLRYCLLYMK